MSIFISAYVCTIFPTFLLVLVVSWIVPMSFAAVIVITVLSNAAFALAVLALSDKVGSLASIIYKGGSTLSKTQQYAGNLDQARYFKRTGQYENALAVINSYLENAERTSEALYLKAQILWHGFRDAAGSKECLNEVLKKTAAQDNYHRWSKELYTEIDRK